MNVLITGAAGFIGSHLAERLLATTDYRLTCVDNFCDFYAVERKHENIKGFRDSQRVTFVEADIGDAVAMSAVFDEADPEAIVHLAAHAGVSPSVANPRRYFENNVCGTLNLLECARRRGVERFLYISSSTVYGKGCDAPFREDAPLGIQASPYGASKRAAELLCLTYQELHGVPAVILRPFSVYGPRLRPDLALSVFANRILRGEPITVYGDGTVRRDFTHVRDICGGIQAAITSPEALGHCINLGHSQPLEMNEVLELLQSALGRRATIDYRAGRREDMPITHADLSKARRLLGFNAETPFDRGLQEFASWRQSQV